MTEEIKAVEGEIAETQTVQQAFGKTKDAALYAGVSTSTIAAWRKSGLKSYRVGGNAIYKFSDIDEYIQGHAA